MAINNEALQQQLINDLLIESFEGLDRFDREMLALEKGERQPDTMNVVFRVIHTIKGTAGCIGLGKIESVAHVGENLLSLLRDNKLQLQPAMIAALLEYSDALKEMLRCLEKNGQQGDTDYSSLLDKLKRLQSGEPVAEVAAQPTPEIKPPAEQGWGLFEEEPVAGSPAVQPAVPLAAAPEPAAAAVLAPERRPATEAVSAARTGASVSDSAIRVDVGQLDKLMNLVGELVLARNQIIQFTNKASEPALLNAAQRLNIITTELQESVMKTRMQPIGNIWAKYPRIVRDVAHELGKKVKLVMEGQETELDRTIIEAIKDPLTHIIRNAIDHGIEMPDVRAKAGKAEEGLLILRSFHEGGQVNIEILDDGQGINLARVKKKAIEKNLLTAEQAQSVGDREALNLIFLPGFSTAEKVTNVSGRGVGMDVVKTNVEKIGGSVDIFSEAGQGSSLKIKVPLTLAIIPALIVTSAGERFAIPQVNLLELVRLEGGKTGEKIETIYGAPVYRLRGQLLPLVHLQKALAGDEKSSAHKGNTTHAGDAGAMFEMARAAHRDWLRKLRQVLDGTLAMTVEEAGSHRMCKLGKWIYSEGEKNYADLAEVTELEKVHEQFHNLVREIVMEKNAGNHAKAEKLLHGLGRLSERVIGLLASAEKRVQESQNSNIVVLNADGRQFGLVVDEINDTEEIVVKPLGKQLKGIACYAGATIMGDGRVALILDVLGLAQFTKVIAEVHDRGVEEKIVNAEPVREKQTLLLFDAGDRARLAIPLSTVARLEEFPRRLVEHSGDQEVVQYRGQIMPLIPISKYFPGAQASTEVADPMQVVVYSDQGRSVGLVVGHINDIVHETVSVRRDNRRAGIAGSAVIQNRVTDLLDVPGIIRAADPNFYAAADASTPPAP